MSPGTVPHCPWTPQVSQPPFWAFCGWPPLSPGYFLEDCHPHFCYCLHNSHSLRLPQWFWDYITPSHLSSPISLLPHLISEWIQTPWFPPNAPTPTATNLGLRINLAAPFARGWRPHRLSYASDLSPLGTSSQLSSFQLTFHLLPLYCFLLLSL